MTLNEYLQARIDRKARENAPDQFSVDHARALIKAVNDHGAFLHAIVLDYYENYREIGLLSADVPAHVHASAVVETFQDALDQAAYGEAIDVLQRAERAE